MGPWLLLSLALLSYEAETWKEEEAIVDLSNSIKAELTDLMTGFHLDEYKRIVGEAASYREDKIEAFLDSNINYVSNVLQQVDEHLGDIAEEVVANKDSEAAETELTFYNIPKNTDNPLYFEPYHTQLANFSDSLCTLPQFRPDDSVPLYKSLLIPLTESMKETYQRVNSLGTLNPLFEVSFTSLISGATRSYPIIIPIQAENFKSVWTKVPDDEVAAKEGKHQLPENFNLVLSNTDRRLYGASKTIYSNSDVFILFEYGSSIVPTFEFYIKETVVDIINSLSESAYLTVAMFSEDFLAINPYDEGDINGWFCFNAARTANLFNNKILSIDNDEYNVGRIASITAMFEALKQYITVSDLFAAGKERNRTAIVVTSGFYPLGTTSKEKYRQIANKYSNIEFVHVNRFQTQAGAVDHIKSIIASDNYKSPGKAKMYHYDISANKKEGSNYYVQQYPRIGYQNNTLYVDTGEKINWLNFIHSTNKKLSELHSAEQTDISSTQLYDNYEFNKWSDKDLASYFSYCSLFNQSSESGDYITYDTYLNQLNIKDLSTVKQFGLYRTYLSYSEKERYVSYALSKSSHEPASDKIIDPEVSLSNYTSDKSGCNFGLHLIGDSLTENTDNYYFSRLKNKNFEKLKVYCDTYNIKCDVDELTKAIPNKSRFTDSLLFLNDPLMYISMEQNINPFVEEYKTILPPPMPYITIDQTIIRRALFSLFDKLSVKTSETRLVKGPGYGDHLLIHLVKPIFTTVSTPDKSSAVATVTATLFFERLFPYIGSALFKPVSATNKERIPFMLSKSPEINFYLVKSPYMIYPIRREMNSFNVIQPNPTNEIMYLIDSYELTHSIYQDSIISQVGENNKIHLPHIVEDYWSVTDSETTLIETNAILHVLLNTSSNSYEKIISKNNLILWAPIPKFPDLKLVLAKKYFDSMSDNYLITLDKLDYSVDCNYVVKNEVPPLANCATGENDTLYLPSIYAEEYNTSETLQKDFDSTRTALFYLSKYYVKTGGKDDVIDAQLAHCISQTMQAYEYLGDNLYDYDAGCTNMKIDDVCSSPLEYFRTNFLDLYNSIWVHRYLINQSICYFNEHFDVKFVVYYSSYPDVGTVYPGYYYTSAEMETFAKKGSLLYEKDEIQYYLSVPHDFPCNKSIKYSEESHVAFRNNNIFPMISLLTAKVTGCKEEAKCTALGSVTVAFTVDRIRAVLMGWLEKHDINVERRIILFNENLEVLVASSNMVIMQYMSLCTVSPSTCVDLYLNNVITFMYLNSNDVSFTCKKLVMADEYLNMKEFTYKVLEPLSNNGTTSVLFHIPETNIYAVIISDKLEDVTNKIDLFDQVCTGSYESPRFQMNRDEGIWGTERGEVESSHGYYQMLNMGNVALLKRRFLRTEDYTLIIVICLIVIAIGLLALRRKLINQEAIIMTKKHLDIELAHKLSSDA